jgi:glycosyltransferase involved in cell wall biosynthesis
MSNPLISICIPTYCGKEYLLDCLDSVVAQTFLDFEILIVDDGSTDNTIDIIREYMIRDSRIKLFCNEKNLGLVGNWNRCIELAQGEWIKFVFQDDTLEPTCLEKMLVATQLGKPIIYCHRNFIFEAGTDEAIKEFYLTHASVQNSLSDTIEISAQQYTELALKNIGVNFVGEPTSVMLHRSVFIQFGSFNPHLIMICDFEFYTRIAIHTGIVQISEALANFRVHGTAASAVSKVNRQYRGWTLDGLILIHDFAFHTAYLPLRTMAQQCHPKINLAQLFKQRAFAAWKIARREQYLTEVSDFSPHIELEKVSQFYPLISRILELNILEYFKDSVLLQWDLLVVSLDRNLRRTIPITRIKAKIARFYKIDGYS